MSMSETCRCAKCSRPPAYSFAFVVLLSLSLFFGTQGTCALTCAALLACPFGLSLALPGWAPSVMFCTSITVAVAAFKIVEFVLRRSPEGCVYSFGFRKCRTLIQEGGGEVMDTVIFFYSGDAGA